MLYLFVVSQKNITHSISTLDPAPIRVFADALVLRSSENRNVGTRRLIYGQKKEGQTKEVYLKERETENGVLPSISVMLVARDAGRSSAAGPERKLYNY